MSEPVDFGPKDPLTSGEQLQGDYSAEAMYKHVRSLHDDGLIIELDQVDDRTREHLGIAKGATTYTYGGRQVFTSPGPEQKTEDPERKTLTPAEFAGTYQNILNRSQWHDRIATKIVDQHGLALSKAVTHSEKSAIHSYAELLWWRYLSFPGSLPPPSILFVKSTDPDATTPIMRPSPQEGLAPSGAYAYARYAWRTQEMDVLNGINYFESEAFTESAVQLLRGGETYRFLSSFMGDTDHFEQLPLTPEERMIRESHIREKIHEAHGLPINHVTVGDQHINREVNRATSLLDEETTPKRSGSNQDMAMERFRAFVEQFVPEGGTVKHHSYQVANEIFEKLDFDNPEHTNSTLLRLGAQYMFQEMIINAYNTPSGYSGSYQNLLGSGLHYGGAEISGQIFKYLRDDALAVPGLQQHTHLDYELKLPRGVTLSEEEYQRFVNKQPNLEDNNGFIDFYAMGGANFTGQETYLKNSETVLARIIRREAPSNYQDMRLVELVGHNPNLSGNVHQADLLITCLDNQIVKPGTDPFIPGYDLVFRDDKGTFGFAKSEFDPYETDIPLGPKLTNLIAFYKDKELHELVEHIEADPPTTARELAKIISEGSHYLLPEKGVELPHIDIHDLIAALTRDGKLYLQCDSAATFLMYSLKIAYGQDAYVGVRSGHVFDSFDTTIDANKHAQVVLAFDGVQTILDAVPALDGFSAAAQRVGTGGLIKSLKRAFARKPRSTYNAEQQTTENEDSSHEQELKTGNTDGFEAVDRKREEASARLRQEKVEHKTTNLLQSLSNVFDEADRDKLLAKLNNLDNSDPVRRVASFALRLQSGEASIEEAAQHLEYVTAYTNADGSTLRKAHMREVAPHVLTMLRSYLKNL
jgi:hypothetical protein